MSAPKLSLSVQYAAEGDDLPSRGRFRRWVTAALTQDAQLTLRLVGADEGRGLNRDFRGKDYATNVLTFIYGDGLIPGMPLAGDIVLCVPVVAREAAEQGKVLEAHFAHLTVHGMLHLQGYDHEEEADAERMEALESKIVTRLGYADPYGEA